MKTLRTLIVTAAFVTMVELAACRSTAADESMSTDGASQRLKEGNLRHSTEASGTTLY